MQSYGDNFIFVIPVETKEHSEERPFCWDERCPCHKDPTLIAPVMEAYTTGLLTDEEKAAFIAGRSL